VPNTTLSAPLSRLRFGLFELDPDAEELHKSGLRVRIQGQPLRILLYLAQRPGQIVTREELHRVFWKPDTTIDLDRSLAAAIHKIRECLNDSVTSPRFVETVSRSGYRFIAPVVELQPDPAATPVSLSASTPLPQQIGPPGAEPLQASASAPPGRAFRTWVPHRPFLWGALATVAGAVLLMIYSPSESPMAGNIRPVTRNANVFLPEAMSQGFPGAVTDNARIYFPRSENGRSVLATVMLNGGDSTTIALPEELGSPVADDVSPDGLRLLLRDRLSTAREQALWVASPAGQTARQIPGVLAHDSTWMPDGDTILYANGNKLYTVHDDGSTNTLFASLPGRAFRMRWSPDGKRLRLTVRDDLTLATSLWELRANGSGAHRLLDGWHQDESVCCGEFLSGGDLYVFQAGQEPNGSLWAVTVGHDWLGRQRDPFRLAEGPLGYSSPAAKHNGRGIVFAGMAPTFHLLRSDLKDGRLLPALDFLNDAVRVECSPDGRWISWVRRDDGSLWRSRPDGTDRLRVLGAPYRVFNMAWSPTATRLAVMARRPGAPWRILLADVNSGHNEELLRDDPHNQADPQWSANGTEILFGRLPQRIAEPARPVSLLLVDLASRKATEVPGSTGLFSPRVSPDGRTVLALDGSQTTLRQLDLTTGLWTTVATGHFDDLVFQAGGRTVVFHDFAAPEISLVRLDLATHQLKPLADGSRSVAGFSQPVFAGLLPDGEPAISVAPNGADLYELEVPGVKF
jgi:DNA-binding winged helix-turn-helix (wHTH) protein/WD40 repeat protein